MKSKLFLMRTVKSRALPKFNETFYFLLCRVIASFKSSSTTCQARSCMIINIQQTSEILFFCNGFKIFELQLKLLNSNSTELSVLFYICSNNLKQKKSDIAYASNVIWNISKDSNSFKLYKFLICIEFAVWCIMWSIYADSILSIFF